MSDHPPPPRKPPAARPPMPHPAGGKPPLPQKPAAYAPEEPAPAASSSGTIIAVVIVVAALLIGLPAIAGAGFFFYQARQADLAAKEKAAAEREKAEAQRQRKEAEEAALCKRLEPTLYEKAKNEAIAQHWTPPEGLQRKRWADWSVRKVGDSEFEISGILQLSVRDEGTHTYKWACRYSTEGKPAPSADWKLERVTIDGKKVYPPAMPQTP